MTKDDTQRRLAAVLVADLVGFSRLMAADEAGMLRDLERCRRDVDACIRDGGGRLVSFVGDGFLAEFPSVRDGIETALAVQRAMPTDDDRHGGQRRLEFRMGLHVGDVLVDGDSIAGNGVNIAARLEPLAEPGGLCVSEVVRQHLLHVDGFAFEDIGDHDLKNIPGRVRVYRVRDGGNESRSVSARADAVRALPAIAVLPFDGMSSDADEEFFADGMTEDLITELARCPGLAVIARHSCFTYKGRAAKVQDVARDLGVDYVLEGSVRRAVARVRINAQLIDARSGHHVWAERFDRDLDDVFALQDEVVRAVAANVDQTVGARAVPPSLHRDRAGADPVAYECYLRGRYAWNRRTTADVQRAIGLFEEAIRLDPRTSQFHAALAQALVTLDEHSGGRAGDVAERALRAARRAVELDPESADAATALGGCQTVMEWDYAAGRASLARAVTLAPSAALPHHWKGQVEMGLGAVAASLESFARACELDPLSPLVALEAGFYGQFFAGRIEPARVLLRRALRLDPTYGQAHALLALLEAHVGATDAALHHAYAGVDIDAASVHAQAALAYALGRAGRGSDADRAIEDLERRARERYVNPALLAVAHAGVGRSARVLDLLEQMIVVRAWSPMHLSAAPMWDEVRDTARFRALAARMRLPSRLAPHTSAIADDTGASRPAPMPTEAAVATGRFRQEGEYWTLEFAGMTARVGDSRGMRYLACLVESPFQAVRATLLEGGHGAGPAPSTEGLATDTDDDAGELLDRPARDAYRAQIRELQAEVDDASACNDLGRAERARAQLEAIAQELRRAIGLGGRVRRAGARTERARVNVTKAIRAAIGRIRAAHPPLGAHFEETVRTGTECTYHPDPRRPPRWNA